jgi:F1F0 ATPase subunit 2
MHDFPGLVLALVAGVAIGIFYFGGLWWTVQRLTTARQAALLATASFLGRTFVSTFAFFMVMGGSWQRLVVSVLGFVTVRSLLVRHWRPVRTTTEVRKGV